MVLTHCRAEEVAVPYYVFRQTGARPSINTDTATSSRRRSCPRSCQHPAAHAAARRSLPGVVRPMPHHGTRLCVGMCHSRVLSSHHSGVRAQIYTIPEMCEWSPVQAVWWSCIAPWLSMYRIRTESAAADIAFHSISSAVNAGCAVEPASPYGSVVLLDPDSAMYSSSNIA